jgi:hypothetical protein
MLNEPQFIDIGNCGGLPTYAKEGATNIAKSKENITNRFIIMYLAIQLYYRIGKNSKYNHSRKANPTFALIGTNAGEFPHLHIYGFAASTFLSLYRIL